MLIFLPFQCSWIISYQEEGQGAFMAVGFQICDTAIHSAGISLTLVCPVTIGGVSYQAS